MPRIPPEELERLKREVSVVRLAEARGVKLKAHGRDRIGLCPFHDDREPSLVLSPEKNLWHCLGACQQGGSVVDWVMKAEGVSFRHAVELLRRQAPLAGKAAGPPPKRSLSPKLGVLAEPTAEDAELLARVVGYYHETLLEAPEALAYLESRGLAHPEMIEHFQLGFANRTLGYRLPGKHTAAGEELRGRLQRFGVLRESGHEHFTGCLVIPVLDEAGRVLSMYGRKIGRAERAGDPVHLYLAGPHRGVFNLSALESSKEIILCEALLDALTFWCAGFRHVTSAYGVNGFTEELFAALSTAGTARVFLAYDRDEAGEKAAEALAARLVGAGIECLRVLFPRGMDANEYASKVQPAAKSLGLALQQAVWMGKGPAPREPLTPALSPLRGARGPEGEASATPLSAAPPAPLLAACPEPSEEPGREAGLSSFRPPLPPAGEGWGEGSPASPSLATPPPVPPAGDELAVERCGEEVFLAAGDRRYRVRGLARNLSFELLKVNLLASRGEAFHVDTFDLYAARPRGAFAKQAAAELGLEETVVQKDLGRVLLSLERLQAEALAAALQPKPAQPAMSAEERAAALELLSDPRLVERIVEDLARCGVVGEGSNKLLSYLAALSRKLEEPLAVVIQSSSAAGKTSLLDAVLSLVPPEERISYSAMTGQSLYYLGEKDLAHKVLSVVEEEGAERASYALKLLQSEGELAIASTGKDPATGRLVTHEYRVEGPVAIFLTTTAIDLDEELLNRCLVLSVEESREQTRAIHQVQREKRTLDGLFRRREREVVRKLHHNAQRLLEPLAVVNPFAPRLTFLDTQTRSRRDHEKYLTLIDVLALLHQHQREVKTAERGGQVERYIEVTLEDIELANRLAAEVLGRSLDELPPPTRRFVTELSAWVEVECRRVGMKRAELRFTARQVREVLGLGATQVKLHLRRLVELEYVLVHRGAAGWSVVYELAYGGEGDGGGRFLPGLIDVKTLRYPARRPASKGGRSASGRPVVGGRSVGGRFQKERLKERRQRDFAAESNGMPKTTSQAALLKTAGYVVEGTPEVRP